MEGRRACLGIAVGGVQIDSIYLPPPLPQPGRRPRPQPVTCSEVACVENCLVRWVSKGGREEGRDVDVNMDVDVEDFFFAPPSLPPSFPPYLACGERPA